MTQNAERGASTDLIAQNLDTFSGTGVSTTYYDNVVNASAVSGINIQRYGSVLHIYSTNSTDFQIEVVSTWYDHLLVFKDETPDFKKLPVESPDDFVIKVSGDNQKAQDDFYVKFNDGVWKETNEPASLTQLDNTTLPHKLTKLASGNFQFDPVTYAERKVGDDDTNPFPSFIGFTLSDIFFHRNRLGVLADENVIFSRAGEFINFDFQKVSVTAVDSDPVDVAVSSNKGILKHAVPFNESLLLFSDLTQFKVTADPVLTPETVNVANTTEFEASLRAKPAQAGKFVYFASKRVHGQAWEYFVDSDTDTNDASEISAHVPKYLAGEVINIQASSMKTCYLYKQTMTHKHYMYIGTTGRVEKNYRPFGHAGYLVVMLLLFFQQVIFLLIKRGNNLFLERINLSVDEATEYTDGASLST